MFKFYCYICNFRYCVWTPLTRGEESGDCHCDRVTEDECNTCRGSFVHAYSNSKLQTWWPSNIERLGRSSEVYIRYQYGGYLFTRNSAHCFTMCERGINTFSQLNCASGIYKFDALLGHDGVFLLRRHRIWRHLPHKAIRNKLDTHICVRTVFSCIGAVF